MIYFDGKYLSNSLSINPAKWKRWAREFLPPDPLGGYQSGYARQFSFKDAFRVFLGGHLVGVLRFTIPEACRILSDLETWFRKQGLYAMPDGQINPDSDAHHIYIFDLKNGNFAYAIRTILSRQKDDTSIHTERYTLTLIGANSDTSVDGQTLHARVIFIRALHQFFLEAVMER